MKLIDWMMEPDPVYVSGNYATDRYVVIDQTASGVVDYNSVIRADGAYKLARSGAYQQSGQAPGTSGMDFKKVMEEKANDSFDWVDVKLSNYTTLSANPKKPGMLARVGSMGGRPVFVSAVWSLRLPDGFKLQAHSAEKPWRIVREDKARMVHGTSYTTGAVVGLVNPLRVNEPSVTDWAIAAELDGYKPN